MHPIEHLIYQLRSAPVRTYPFPHIWLENVFPLAYYQRLCEALIGDFRFQQIAAYPNRQFCNDLPPDLMKDLSSLRLAATIRDLFRLSCDMEGWIRWTRDGCGYSLGPHTDTTSKVASLLFYMPSKSQDEGPWGTSLYLPKEPVDDDGQKHWRFDKFHLIHTFPFQANTCLAFPRADNSWHGVEPIVSNIQRDMIVYTLNHRTGGSK